MRPGIVLLSITLLFVALGGCSSDEVLTATVTGDVTLDGAPLAEGSIQFTPLAGDKPTAGTTIKDGKFEVSVPVTKMRVEINATKVVGQRKAYDSPQSIVVDVVESIIPKKYNVQSELTLDVKEGDQTVRYDLQTK